MYITISANKANVMGEGWNKNDEHLEIKFYNINLRGRWQNCLGARWCVSMYSCFIC